jgi:hypothetical protein
MFIRLFYQDTVCLIGALEQLASFQAEECGADVSISTENPVKLDFQEEYLQYLTSQQRATYDKLKAMGLIQKQSYERSKRQETKL